MKKSFKGFLACLLALMLVIPAFSGVLADSTAQVGTIQAKDTAPVDVSGIRNGKTFEAVETTTNEVSPTDIVTIMVELDAVPTVDLYKDVNTKSASDYRVELLASHKVAAEELASTLGVEVKIDSQYSVIFNGFTFTGEYRLVALINEMPGMSAFVPCTWESPNLYNSTSMVNAIEAWDLDYSGEGTIVAIIDTGLKVDHPAFSTQPDGTRFKQNDIANFIATGRLYGGSGMNVNQVFYSSKIPFRWNYYTNTYDVSHRASDHGTHVAGIAAGNGGEIVGVAKDAQIAGMQVFSPSGGASWDVIMRALEDCVVLGVDAANMSLGSPCGVETPWNPSYADVLERCTAAGVNMAMSAGNEGNAGDNNAWGTGAGDGSGYNLVQNPDYGVVGSPSTWPASLSVAAVENSKERSFYVTVNGIDYGYTENADNRHQLAATLGGGTYEYVMVPGFGTEEDFAQVDVAGKIAVVSRGETDFTAKAGNAEAAGAIACIVHNNVDGVIYMVAYAGGGIPHVAISLAAGQALAAATDKHITISSETGLIDAIGGGEPTGFSSWGTTPTLGLKPEITAPGGNIYSSTDRGVSGADYQAWDGTSMSAPHVAGGMAVITAYVNEMFPNLTAREKQNMVSTILMSTANPVCDAGGNYAAVRSQGAGMMNLASAVSTKAYITVAGCERPKIEMGDDPSKNGVYTLNFTVHNFGDTELEYVVSPSVLIDDIGILGTYGADPVIVYLEQSLDLVKEGMVTIDKPATVVVPAGGETAVTVEITLNDETKAYLNEYYTSGAFIEGFIELLSMDGEVLLGDADGDGVVRIADALLVARHALGLMQLENAELLDVDGDGNVRIADALITARIGLGLMQPIYGGGVGDGISLTLPYLGYYGDWNYAPVLDQGYYYQDISWQSHPIDNTVGYRSGSRISGLGINPFIDPGDMSYYLADRNAVSPNGDGVLDTVNVLYAGLLRGAANVKYLALDANGRQLEVIMNVGSTTKGYYDSNGGYFDQLGVNFAAFPGYWDPTDYGMSDIILQLYTELDNDGRHKTAPFTQEANASSCWNIPIHVDTTMPTVVANSFNAAGGNFNFTVTDDHYVAYVATYTNNNGQLGNLVGEVGVYETARGLQTQITLPGQTNNYVLIGDYAGNTTIYLWNGSTLQPVNVDPDPEPVGEYTEAQILCYGRNLATMQWIMIETTDITSLYNGETTPSGVGINSAAYDGTNVYAFCADNNHMYRYTMTSSGLTNRQDIGTARNSYTEMAYNPANDTIYGIVGAANLVAINPTTLAETPVCSFQYGAVAMDFAADGTLYIVDVYGALATVDMATGVQTDIADTGIAVVSASGSFYSQSGCLVGNTFYWGSISATQVKNLIRFDVNNGVFEQMGVIFNGVGLQAVGMFGLELRNALPVANFNVFSGEFSMAK